MTQEEKQLLLKDLYARLPYDVKICVGFNTKHCYTADIMAVYPDKDYIQIRPKDLHIHTVVYIEDVKPYLRPMSSMTEEEKSCYQAFFNYDGVEYPEDYIDWLNEHHFDYRGLIDKGLAIEAPERMYKM